ncbi:MAG: S1-like domain-containing RNA-binding protein [Muribaculaceae bacterium]|nr:S1-like domain-containing RNA-binding protein [Muribaculaceae bacterium]
MLQIGKFNELEITHRVDFGLYLDGGEEGEILLPLRYATQDMKPGDKINAFIYRDSEDRLIATTEKPYAQVGDFAFLRVNATNNVGAFLDWGLPKDLLVPFREQKVRMVPGRSYTVYVYLDDETQRIVASAKLQKFLDNKIPDIKAGDEVKARIYQRTELGYKVIVNDLFSGLIYHNEIFSEVNIGELHHATVKTVRADGKIDLVLGKSTRNRVNDLADDILDYIEECGGRISLNDSSSPEEIRETFQCSKKDFKKAIGALFKAKQIVIENDGIRLS